MLATGIRTATWALFATVVAACLTFTAFVVVAAGKDIPVKASPLPAIAASPAMTPPVSPSSAPFSSPSSSPSSAAAPAVSGAVILDDPFDSLASRWDVSQVGVFDGRLAATAVGPGTASTTLDAVPTTVRAAVSWNEGGGDLPVAVGAGDLRLEVTRSSWKLSLRESSLASGTVTLGNHATISLVLDGSQATVKLPGVTKTVSCGPASEDLRLEVTGGSGGKSSRVDSVAVSG